ncbi:hypothetical protein PMI07_003452 [Rhizobium sp. CF080]|uniref:hypothetical protein n=1 Tax=Rhizobium sp. (strain CF080) TaxID=1144310 RepID=UPI00027177EF|nr:hypothetical protein [Rhizobium sp. CF080]EUC01467.1 hypothetical protein PMI07_003452 [Rhizobium sp. CF080]
MYQLLFEQAWEDPKQAALRNFALSLAEKIEKLDRNQEIDLVLALAKPETQPLLIQASMQRLQVVETERGAAPELRSHLMDNPRRDTFDDLVSGD